MSLSKLSSSGLSGLDVKTWRLALIRMSTDPKLSIVDARRLLIVSFSLKSPQKANTLPMFSPESIFLYLKNTYLI